MILQMKQKTKFWKIGLCTFKGDYNFFAWCKVEYIPWNLTIIDRNNQMSGFKRIAQFQNINTFLKKFVANEGRNCRVSVNFNLVLFGWKFISIIYAPNS